MKVIYPNLLGGVAVDLENPNFPGTNVEDDHPKNIWKSTSNTGRMYCAAGSGSNALAMFNTNATTVTVSVMDGISVKWNDDASYTTVTWNADVSYTVVTWTPFSSPTVLYSLNPNDVGSLWGEYTAIAYPHIVLFEFAAAAGTIVQAGVVTIGAALAYADPGYDVHEGLHDYSIVKELNNGAVYIRKRDIVRTFDLQIREDRDPDWYEFMHDLALANGPNPVAWFLAETVNDWEFVVFARFRDQLPRGVLDSPNLGLISFTLIEVI